VEYDTLTVVGGRANGRFRAVDEPILFWVADDEGSASDTFSVIPIDPAALTELSASLHYPAYLDRPDEVVRGPISSLQVPRGTVIGWSVRSNHALRRLGVSRAFESGMDTVWLSSEDNRAEGEIVATRSAYLSWVLITADGVPATRATSGIHLTVVSDSPPTVRFVEGGGDATLGADGRLPLLLEAEDDHGIAGVELIWWREAATGVRDASSREPLLGDEGPRHVLLRPVLELAGADLVPGDVIAYYATASDRNMRNPPSATDTFRVEVPGLVESRREAFRQAEDLAGGLRSLQERTSDLGDAARDAERRASRTGPAPSPLPASEDRPGFTASEEARDLLREAESVRDELEREAERLRELRERAAGAPWPDPGVQRQLGELERLLEEVRRSGLADEIEALERALTQRDRADLQEALSNLSARSGRWG
jgi:hypothetical protein